jgi:hypothetical protein
MDVSGAKLNHSHKLLCRRPKNLRQNKRGVSAVANKPDQLRECGGAKSRIQNPAKERLVWTVRSHPLKEWNQDS